MTHNSLDPYNNESKYIHSEEWRRRLAELERRRQEPNDTQIGGTSPAFPSAAPAARTNQSAPRKRMGADIKACIVIAIVCLLYIAVTAPIRWHW